MASLFGKNMTRREVEKCVGSMDQICGLRRAVLNDGRGRGLEVIDLKTGGGLEITVTPGRTLDILDATLNGCPFAWMSPAGPVHPAYARTEGDGILRSFSGGFMTTCGLSNIGVPCEDKGEVLGLHGRVWALAAREVNTSCRWVGNDYVMSIEGEVREYALYGANFRLARRITAWLGRNRILVEDVVENASPRRLPHQILYHLNLGYPLIDAGAETRLRAKSTLARETGVEAAPADWARFPAPNPRFAEQCFFHEPRADAQGMGRVAVVNRKANGGDGLAVLIRFSRETLPWVMQWRCACTGEYVQGIEPANGWVVGRDKDRKAGRLQFLKPGEARSYTLEFDFLSGKKNLAAIRV